MEDNQYVYPTMIGSVVSHYTILEKLGEGGMGIVYKARDTRLERLVALKFLPARLNASESDKARFIQEAKDASSLNHPNVCTIHDIGEHDGQTFIVMEYVDGVTLRDREKKSEFNFVESVDLGGQIAEGLAAAHANGIVHRDIKPENIMVRSDGRALIMDFGLAKLQGVTPLTKAGSTVGTTAYMSPEQVQGLEADQRSDVFALGVVLYELLAGQLPFKGGHEAAVMYEIVNVNPPFLSSLKPGIDPDAEPIVMKCLEKDPGNRYQNARDLAADLKRLKRDSEPGHGAGSSSPRRKMKSAAPTGRPWIKIAAGLFALCLLVAAGLYLARHRGGAIESLAVLPFVNASGDSTMEYLGDGITESLINSLSQLPKLKVMSRSSVFRFKGDRSDPQTVGQKLGVRGVLLGRVSQRGDNLNISAELIDASDNSHLWGEQYNRKSSDILAIQEEIAREISQALRLRLGYQADQPLIKASTENTGAYQLYLKGRYYWNKRSTDGLRKAIDYFQQAVDTDPAYALAYSGLSDAYSVLGWFEYGIVPPKDVYSKSLAAARKAMEIDSNRAESRTSVAFAMEHYEDHAAAERNFKAAIELNPGYATAHHWYSEMLMTTGRTDESIAEIKRALALDPLSIIITRDVGWMFYFARRYDEANDYCRKSLEMDSTFSRGHLLLGESLLQQGAVDQAISEFKTASRLSEGTIPTIMLACGYAKGGRTREAKEILERLLALSRTKYVPPGVIALIYIALGERDRAFEWLERARDEGSGVFGFVNFDPVFDPIREDPRFAALLARGGFMR